MLKNDFKYICMSYIKLKKIFSSGSKMLKIRYWTLQTKGVADQSWETSISSLKS